MEQSKLFQLGLIPYQEAYLFQQQVWERVHAHEFDSCLILCRHYPVITLGRRAKEQNILKDRAFLKQKGISFYSIERGGDVTYHGPGQLTGYPIINLSTSGRDIRSYLRALEEMIISSLIRFGIRGERRGQTAGVWVGERKIASIGVAVRKWVSWHGFTLNVSRDDLAAFSYIRPCGQEITMTSMETEAGQPLDLDEVSRELIKNYTRRIPWQMS